MSKFFNVHFLLSIIPSVLAICFLIAHTMISNAFLPIYWLVIIVIVLTKEQTALAKGMGAVFVFMFILFVLDTFIEADPSGFSPIIPLVYIGFYGSFFFSVISIIILGNQKMTLRKPAPTNE